MKNSTILDLHESIQAYKPDTVLERRRENQSGEIPSFDELIKLVHSLSQVTPKERSSPKKKKFAHG